MSYASSTFSMHRDDAGEPSQWSNDFRKLIRSIDTTSHKITSLLSLLSSSLSNGQPLPPYLEMPQPYHFVKRLESIDADLLSIRHVAEPEYSAFAVLQVCGQAMNKDLQLLVKYAVSPPRLLPTKADKHGRYVKTLVGETDFSFHAISSSKESTHAASTDDDDVKGKED